MYLKQLELQIMKRIIASGVLVFIFTIAHSFTTSTEIHENEYKNKHVSISRLDKDLFNYLNSPSQELTKSLIDNYPHTLPALAQTINSNNTNVLEVLQTYFSHPTLIHLYKDALIKFENLENYENALTAMSSIAEKEFGRVDLPQFSTHISGLKENTIYINNTISLSIDKYMGSDYPGYKGYFRPHQLQQMQPKMIVRDMTKAWLMADYVKTENTNGDMLSEIIEHGKLLYALSVLLPTYTEHDLIGYTDQEYNWCTNNHKRLWDAIIKQNHLYTTDRHIIYRYFDEAPNTKAAIKGTPGQIGSWIGLQIVKQYAKESKQNLKAIIRADDRTILKESKYKQ